MTANVHPTSNDLLVAAQEPDRAPSTFEHLDECLACRVRFSRIREAAGLPPADNDNLQRVVQASMLLPDVLAGILTSISDEAPQPNEIWRVGGQEALLVWVRRVFEDGVADVVPLVLDVELADQESVIVAAESTPLATETVAMVALRTHIHLDTFLNRVSNLDISAAVGEVMAAMREGRRPSGVTVGPPIDDDDDQRLEYRQALRDLLGELSPSTWLDAHETSDDDTVADAEAPATGQRPEGFDTVESDLGERLPGLRFQDAERRRVTVDGTVHLTCVSKVVCLDTTVLVAVLDGPDVTDFPEINTVAAACEALTKEEPVADAVAVAIPSDDWPALLFTTSHLRHAVEIPGGKHRGPTVTLEGHGLVDTICKHLEGAVTAWEITEPVSDLLGTIGLHQIARAHALTSIQAVSAAGRRAQQAAKRAGWQSLSAEYSEQVARFVVEVVNGSTVTDALAELGVETFDD
ncbi:MAG: hypothetical protein WBA97_22340 [Actinophytocola sp.]|uniref:hypothetical protein n=1 Tax=Actinophytocola sp. TaxID=1872138 RepID=UPI003C74E978